MPRRSCPIVNFAVVIGIQMPLSVGIGELGLCRCRGSANPSGVHITSNSSLKGLIPKNMLQVCFKNLQVPSSNKKRRCRRGTSRRAYRKICQVRREDPTCRQRFSLRHWTNIGKTTRVKPPVHLPSTSLDAAMPFSKQHEHWRRSTQADPPEYTKLLS